MKDMDIIKEFERREPSLWFRASVVAAAVIVAALLAWFVTSPVTSHINLFRQQPKAIVSVTLTNKGFSPERVHIQPNTEIRWHNQQDNTVRVTMVNSQGDKVVDTGDILPGELAKTRLKLPIGTSLKLENSFDTSQQGLVSIVEKLEQ